MMQSSEAPAAVKREDGRVWIEGVPKLGWGTGRECTFAGALEAALGVSDHPYGYTDIMGFTGLAFRARWFAGNEESRWCPSSTVGEMPEEIEAFSKATGWPLRPDFVRPDDADHMARVTAEFVKSVERGRPALAYEPKLNMDVVFGYEGGGKILLLRDYFRPDDPLKLAPSELGFLVIFIGEHTEALPTRDAFVKGLQIAVRNWDRERFTTGPGEYWYGEAAFDDWIGDIAAAETLTEEERKQLFMVNWWNFEALADARAPATKFVRDHVELLGLEAEKALRRAAALWEQELATLAPAFSQHDAFLGPWTDMSIEDWTPEVRARERELLTQARDLDAKALAEIAKALALADSSRVSAYGFRRDPMEFVRKDGSLQGALVRAFVFETPADDDAAIIRKRIEEILAEQREDGSFGDTSKETGEKLLRLLELGFARDSAEVERGVEALLRQKRAGQNADEWVEKEEALSIYALHALCLLGRSDVPEVGFSLKWYVEHPEEWNDPWKGCPWTPEVFWSALWAGREYGDTAPTIEDGMRRVADSMNAAGCCAYNYPYGFVDAAGQIALPAARCLVEKQVPMILRGQQADGGWGDNSLFVFRALKKHGFLEPLRDRPPLPPDWKVVRSVPAPGVNLWSLAWDGQLLWVHDREDNSAIAVSPEDGQVIKKVKLPVENVVAIGWWDDSLAATQKDPKMLLQVDPESGEVKRKIVVDETDWTWVGSLAQVDGKIWVADEFSPCVIVIDPANPDDRERKILAGPGPLSFAPQADGVWHSDFWTSALIKTSYDGQRLWALDGDNNRICIIEKAPQQPRSQVTGPARTSLLRSAWTRVKRRPTHRGA